MDIQSRDELDSKEIYYIAQESNSYNILAGGGGRRGAPMSEHAKKLLSEKNRAKMTGKKHSELSKARMSASRTGQPYTRHRSTTVWNFVDYYRGEHFSRFCWITI